MTHTFYILLQGHSLAQLTASAVFDHILCVYLICASVVYILRKGDVLHFDTFALIFAGKRETNKGR